MSHLSKFSEQIPIALLSLLVIKAAFWGSSLPEMGSLLGVAAICAINTYMQRNKQIQDFTGIINKQSEVIQTMAVEISKLKSYFEGVRAKEGFKKLG